MAVRSAGVTGGGEYPAAELWRGAQDPSNGGGESVLPSHVDRGNRRPPGARARRPRRRARDKSKVILLLLVGICGVGGGGFALVHELMRSPTHAELATASKAEVALRWQELPAGQVFPVRLSYPMPIGSATGRARLVGIAPMATCSAAVAPAAAAVLHRYHCRGVLRATYTDQSGALLATVGVAVMDDSHAAWAAFERLSPPGRVLLHPAGFGGTVAEGFSDSAVRYFNLQAGGPYVVFDAGGYTDHRAAANIDSTKTNPANPLYFADGLANDVLHSLTKKVPPCEAVSVRC
jgi:hypothetical protein